VTAAFALFVGSAALVAVTVTVCALLILEGAVYRPVLEIDPVGGFNDHETEVSLALLTVAANCCVCKALRFALPGVTRTETGAVSVTLAVPVLLGSATLVAITLTVCDPLTTEGAEYTPDVEMDPIAALRDHVTEALLALLTDAVNCWV